MMSTKSKVSHVDPPPPRWGVRTPQVQPTLKKKGPVAGGHKTPKGGSK